MFSLYKKELHSFFCTPFAYVISSLFMLLFSFFIGNQIADMTSSTIKFTYPDLFYNNIFYFILLIPLLTMRTFADERKLNTEVLLFTSPINVFHLVIAKFLALVTVFIFMLACSIIYPVVTAMNGEIIMSHLISVSIGFFLWGIMCIAIGMLLSSFTENPITAALLSEAVMLALVWLDSFAESDFIARFPKLQAFIAMFTAQPKFVYFARGLIRLSDIVFFISVCVVFLGWTMISIEKRRWNRG